MASIIRVKRSTGTTAPGSLQFGELGLTIGTGTQANKGERLFVGDNSGNVDVVGGRYFTDLMVHAPGTVASVTNPTTAANGFVAILDQNRKVDLWNVDNLTLDANTLSSTNGNGDIIFNPNGSGEVMIPDDTFLGFGGGAMEQMLQMLRLNMMRMVQINLHLQVPMSESILQHNQIVKTQVL